MPDPLQEPPSSEPRPAESQAMGKPSETLASLCEQVAALREQVAVLQARLVRKRPDTNGRRMTRLDRCTYGWRPHPKNPTVLIEDPLEQQMIQRIVELAQNPAMGPRAICRHLDSMRYKRRGGKQWVGRHSLVRSILKRHSAETPAAAKLRILERVAAAKARAADTVRRAPSPGLIVADSASAST